MVSQKRMKKPKLALIIVEQAMQEEIYAIRKNDTYDLVENQKGKTPLKTKRVYRLQHEENG